jgi:DNA-binding transcriptional ArsR family regulator
VGYSPGSRAPIGPRKITGSGTGCRSNHEVNHPSKIDAKTYLPQGRLCGIKAQLFGTPAAGNRSLPRRRHMRSAFLPREKLQESSCAVKWLHIYLQSVAAYMESRRDIFQAIADPTRRAIIMLVALQAMTPGAIAENFDSSRQTISKHIQILRECELLGQEQHGREIYYRLNPRKFREIAAFIEPFRKIWDDRFNKLETLMQSYKSKK